MICPNCGNNLSENALFCGKCGQKVFKPVYNQNKSRGKISTGLTVILAILIFINMFFAIRIFNVRSSIKEENLSRIINNEQTVSILIDKYLDDSDKRDFYDFLENRLYIDINDETLCELFTQSNIGDYVANKISDFGEEFFEGNSYAKLTLEYDDVNDLLMRNSRKINRVLNSYLSDSQLERITEFIFDSEEIDVLRVSEIKRDMPALYYILRICFSYWTAAVLIVLTVVFSVIILIGNLKRGFTALGIDSVIVGILNFGVFIAEKFGFGLAISGNIIYSLIFIIFGICLILASSFAKRLKK